MGQRDAQGVTTSYISPFMPDLAFADDDVKANHQGMLTARQEEMVANSLRWRENQANKTFRFFMWWIPGLLLVGVIIEALQSPKNLGNSLPIVLEVALFLIIAMLGLFLFNRFISRDARLRRISTAEGIANTSQTAASSRGSSYMRYELALNKGAGKKKVFRFGNASSLARFESGKTYRVYYIKYYPFPLILSAEII